MPRPSLPTSLVPGRRLAVSRPDLRRTESVLSIVSIAIGVFVVVAILHLLTGIEISLARQLESVGSRTLYVTKYEQGFQLRQRTAEERRRPDLTFAEAEALRRRAPFLQAVSPEISVRTEVRHRADRLAGVTLVGGTEDYEPAHNAVPTRGRFLSRGDVRARRPVCVIGSAVARALFRDVEPEGRELEIEGRRFTVVGVAARRGSPLVGQAVDRFVLVPYGSFEQLGIPDRFSDFIVAVRPADGLSTDEAVARLEWTLRQIRRLDPGESDNFAITPQTKLLDLYRESIGRFLYAFVALGAVSLLVGGVGILTVMITAVSERTAEIGIRRAVGARRSDIFVSFLVEAAVLTGLGGLAGCGLGFGLVFLFSSLTGIELGFSAGPTVLGVAAAVVTGLVAGVLPAMAAARLEPAVALHYE